MNWLHDMSIASTLTAAFLFAGSLGGWIVICILAGEAWKKFRS